MNIAKYLEQIQDEGQASVMTFHMDSPHTGKGPLRGYKKRKNKVEEQTHSTPDQRERLMIDFDGVIHSYDKGWQNGEIYGTVINNARETIEKLRQKYEIVIFSTRASKTQRQGEGHSREMLIADMERWLYDNGIYYDSITGDKLGAFAYIDDNAIEFTSWDNVLNKLENKEKNNTQIKPF